MSIGNSSPEDRPSVGQAIQQARIDARLTVDEVSTATRIRVPIVHAIEQDDFSRCGGDVYARGHLRTLAKVVGLDPEELLARYDAEHGGRPEPTPAATLFEAERIRPEPSRPNWTAAMVAAIVAVVGFVGFTLFTGDDDAERPPTARQEVPEPTGTTDPAKPADRKPAPGPTESDSAIAAAPADKVTVKLVAEDGQSWFSAEGHDGRLLEENVLKDGESRTFTDDEQINLVLGNAGAVTLYVNGKEVGRAGENGQVQRVSYTKGDPEQG
ncbi:DUF4115 domain-containing protein [Streptomyces carminius]|uniref:DUF4115 domain-containing protein n=1 Tax=Streptomyces carminius TaxID=2665496 RepID=A0A2M8MCX6_9ACTN|nr:helix-turn-helix domain-containing protein [Streptomyces carminius]PJF02082.1 DUF4115 domain-containing protein [Streptomyces carminius]